MRGLLRDRRFPLISAVTALVAGYFWLGSRYPALDDKAAMGGTAAINGLAFDTVLERLPGNGVLWDIAINLLNWTFTNWKGMTFGVLFAACALTLLGLIERRGFGRPFADAALGAAIGAPLGVCVNCAAPIARGLHSAGLRLETTLSAVIASPTLNVIVVSMSFALLPVHMAAIKLVAMLGFVLVGVPLLSRFFFKRESAATGWAETAQIEAEQGRSWLVRAIERIRPAPVPADRIDSWPKAFAWLAVTLGRNLAFIIVVTVPLMIFAGLIGAVLITLLPFHEILRLLPLPGGGAALLLMMVVVALIAIVLPVPISFDVILAVILFNSGWPVAYVMPLLLGLGSFSIYSFFILARAISLRVATVMMATLALVALGGGLVAVAMDRSVKAASEGRNTAFLLAAALPVAPGTAVDGAGATGPTIAYRPLNAAIATEGRGTVTARIATLDASTPGTSGLAFTRMTADKIGIDLPPFRSGIEVFQPYSMFWAITTGDVQGDGWTDVALARNPSQGGVALFHNRGGRFVPAALDLGPLNQLFIATAAFVDLNDDGLPDLFVSALRGGTHVLWNRSGTFDWDARTTLLPTDAAIVGAPAFADLDNDGRLDIVAARWSVGTQGISEYPYLASSRDSIFWSTGSGFTEQALPGVPGESLAALITDVDGDGRPDIMIGDDISDADKVYLNQGGRTFTLLDRARGLIPYLANTTMSFDAGDIDNDLRDEIYVGQISNVSRDNRRTASLEASYCNDPLLSRAEIGACYLHAKAVSDISRYASPTYARCEGRTEALTRGLCAGSSVLQQAAVVSDPRECERVRPFSEDLHALCLLAAGPRVPGAVEAIRSYPGAIKLSNILLRPGAGAYTDQAKAFGVSKPGWTWNSRFVDLDQDGWQDLYVATGYLMHRGGEPNRFYHNQGGKGFVQAQDAFGLASKLPTTTYALIDFDRDGDIDVVMPSMVTQPLVQRSDRPAGGALWVRLEDRLGNRAGVGARIIIRTGGRDRQVREVRQSGGFAAFDAPAAHFGLGDATQVEEVIVMWRDGSRTRISGPIAANSELIVRRD